MSTRAREAQSRAAIDSKLGFLRRIARLPMTPRVLVLGEGRGAALYREALRARGFVEAVEGDRWDVAVFTEFSTLDADIARFAPDTHGPISRIGNFVVRASTAA